MIPGSGPSALQRAALLWWSVTLMFLSIVSCRFAYAQGTYSPGEVLVSLSCGSTCGERVAQVAAAVGTLIESDSRVGVCRVQIRPDLTVPEAVAILKRLPEVKFAEPNLIHQVAALLPNDSHIKSQWGARQIQADLAWQIWQPRLPVVIAVIDSGIDSTHPDLAAKILRDDAGIVGYNAWIPDRSDAMDDFFHGTHCAGIAAAHANNGVGIAGVAGWAGGGGSDAEMIKLMPVKVLDRFGRGTTLSISRGITWAADQGAQVLNLSLGSSSTNQTLSQAVQYALGKGCVIVAAAGNSGLSTKNFPAAQAGVISVGATDQSDTLAWFSSWGSWVAVAAPGVSILSTTPTYPTGQSVAMGYASFSGTSMACPHVAGEAAMLLSHNPNLTSQDVVRLITRNVDPYTPYQTHTLSDSAGRVNVNRALRTADGSAPDSEDLFLSSLSLEGPQAEGGVTVTATVRLRGVASASAQVVSLISSHPGLAVVPPSLVIPPGELSATFPVATKAVGNLTTVTFSATYGGGTRTVSVDLIPVPGALTSFTLSPTAVMGGTPSRGTLRLTTAAPKSGLVVRLESSDPNAASVPPMIVIPYGQKAATVTITTRGINTSTPVTITATLGPSQMGAALTVRAPDLTSFILRPSVVRGARNVSASITLSGPAATGGMRVALSSSHPGATEIPEEVLVPAGATTFTFPFKVSAVSEYTQVQLTAAANGTSRSTTLRLLEVP